MTAKGDNTGMLVFTMSCVLVCFPSIHFVVNVCTVVANNDIDCLTIDYKR
jgi:hypothetical protein